MTDFSTRPEPTDEEAAAIAVAVTLVTAAQQAEPEQDVVPRWRFSGRWWSAPINSRRARP